MGLLSITRWALPCDRSTAPGSRTTTSIETQMTDLILSERVFDDALRTSAVTAEGIDSTWHVLKSSNAARKILTSIADERSRVDLAYVRGLAAGHN